MTRTMRTMRTTRPRRTRRLPTFDDVLTQIRTDIQRPQQSQYFTPIQALELIDKLETLEETTKTIKEQMIILNNNYTTIIENLNKLNNK